MTNEEATELLHQIFDLHINPLAQIVTQTLALLVKNGALKRDEARYSIASAINVIKPLEYSEGAKEDAALVLQRMLSAVEGLPDNS